MRQIWRLSETFEEFGFWLHSHCSCTFENGDAAGLARCFRSFCVIPTKRAPNSLA